MSGVDWKWLPLATAPKGRTDERGRYHPSFVLGFCPEDARPDDPQAGMCVMWWEPKVGDGEWHGDVGRVHPSNWMPMIRKGPPGWK